MQFASFVSKLPPGIGDAHPIHIEDLRGEMDWEPVIPSRWKVSIFCKIAIEDVPWQLGFTDVLDHSPKPCVG